MPRPPETQTPPEEAAPEREWVELRYAPEAKKSFASVFVLGPDRPAVNALREGVDNIVDARDAVHPDITTQAFVTIGDDRVSVLGLHESGMGPAEIRQLLAIGLTEGKGIGLRGSGAKAMAFHLAEDVKIVAKKPGDRYEWLLDEKGFGDPTMSYSGSRPVDPQRVNDSDVGRVEITMTGLKPEKKDLPGGAELKSVLGRIYRPLLPPADVDIPTTRGATFRVPLRTVVNAEGELVEVPDRVAMYVGFKRKVLRVFPQPKPLKEGYDETLKVILTEAGEPIAYWVGELDRSSSASEGKNVKAGVSVFYDGREVKTGEFFGHEERHPALGNLIGEAHVDHVQNIKDSFTIAKSAGGGHSDAWERTRRTMYSAIAPFVEELKHRPVDHDPRIPSGVEDVLTKVRFAVAAALGEMVSGDDVLAELLLGQAPSGVVQGQRRPTHSGQRASGSGEPIGIVGTAWEDQTGRTPPTADADPMIPRKRRGPIDSYKLTDFGDPRIRSALREEVTGPQKKRILEVNTGHPRLQRLMLLMRKQPHAGRLFLLDYIAEQAVRHIADEIGGDKASLVRQYEEKGSFEVARLVDEDPSLSMLKVQPDASEFAKKKKKR